MMLSDEDARDRWALAPSNLGEAATVRPPPLRRDGEVAVSFGLEGMQDGGVDEIVPSVTARIAIAVTVAALACGKQDDKPAGKPGSSSTASDSSAPTTGSGSAAPPHRGASIEAVDVCSFVKKEELVTAGIQLLSKTSGKGSGPVHGTCSLVLEGGGLVSILAYFESETSGFDVDAGKGTAVAGIGAKAIATENRGFFAKVAGTAYYLVFIATSGRGEVGKLDDKLAVEVAKVIVPNAK